MTFDIQEFRKKSQAERQARWDSDARARLERADILSRDVSDLDRRFERGEGTRPVTQAHLLQAAALATGNVVKAIARRRRPTTEERRKEVGRRRSWGGGGNMPANLRAKYTEAERAALSVVADQCRRKGFCALCIMEIAKIAGVGRTSVQNAIRKAASKAMAHITVRERPQHGSKSLTNIIKIVSRDWLGWIGRAIGFKRLSTSETGDRISLSKGVDTPKMAFERECVVAARNPSQAARVLEAFPKRDISVPLWRHSAGYAAPRARNGL